MCARCLLVSAAESRERKEVGGHTRFVKRGGVEFLGIFPLYVLSSAISPELRMAHLNPPFTATRALPR